MNGTYLRTIVLINQRVEQYIGLPPQGILFLEALTSTRLPQDARFQHPRPAARTP